MEKQIMKSYSPNIKNIRIFKRLSTLPDLDGNKIHPTQKPVALYKWILSKYAKAEDLSLRA